jgi:uncharacterized membrane protein YgaE (UPF0421/DUF939 family)
MALDVRKAARRAGEEAANARRRVAGDIGPLLQGTLAAATAWVVAHVVLGRPEPFFAPIAAFIALNSSLGERGINAFRVLEGVLAGIVVGEATLAILGGGLGAIAVAVFTATALARAMNGARVVVAQAASGAILTVAIANGEAGVERLTDALIGAGVALIFSQLLFSPEPLGLLRRAESAVLRRMASALSMVARTLGGEDDRLAAQALTELRELPNDVTELRRLRRASARVARRTVVWRSQREMIVRENENADHLDLLGASCLMLTRVASALRGDDRRALQPSVSDLADVLAALATDLGDRTVRQGSAERAFDVAVGFDAKDPDPDSTLAVAVTAVRLVALDIMAFAGVELDDAVAAVREGAFERRVPAPPARSRGLVGSVLPRLRSWLRGE